MLGWISTPIHRLNHVLLCSAQFAQLYVASLSHLLCGLGQVASPCWASALSLGNRRGRLLILGVSAISKPSEVSIPIEALGPLFHSQSSASLSATNSQTRSQAFFSLSHLHRSPSPQLVYFWE